MKRDKTGIWRGTLSAMMVMLAVVALGSCTKEPIGPSMPGGDGIEVRVSFPRSEAVTRGTETGTPEENRLDRVTIFVFNGDGSQLENVLSVDVTSANTSLPATQPKWATDQTLIVSPVINSKSPKKIYAIANWSNIDFDMATYTEARLKDEITIIANVGSMNGAAAYPMLMSGSKEVANLTSQLYKVTVDLERQASKISAHLTIPVGVQDYMPQIEWQTNQMTITVANVPNRSFVMGRSICPANTTLLNSTPIVVDDTIPAPGDQTFPATKELKWSERVYITENPVTGATQATKALATYIIVQLPYKNRITGTVEDDNYYKVYIDNRGNATSPHTVLRNTIYNLNIIIQGMGLPINNLIPNVNVDNQLTVIPWEKGEMGDVEAPLNYFNVNRTYIEFQLFGTSSQSTIVTDVADWKLVREDGTTVFSFAENKTAVTVIDGITYTLSGTAATATVTVSKPENVINFATQKMSFIAKNLKVPFTVVYDNGIIPNSLLSKSFSSSVGVLQGWPTNTLPPRGLQLAKRGNKKLPHNMAGADDERLKWKTEQTMTTGTMLNIGFGDINTEIMINSSVYPIDHPAAKYCREMGPEWFLPSRDEWLLIYNQLSTLGASYSFYPNHYWSSTGGNDTASWYVYLHTGTTTTNAKTMASRIRCVRYI